MDLEVLIVAGMMNLVVAVVIRTAVLEYAMEVNVGAPKIRRFATGNRIVVVPQTAKMVDVAVRVVTVALTLMIVA
jgi:hypothetical protein